jgi:hypothetical protein|tara:strand:+ start:121 stop:342 length:222 start_codon:yes stop_codon:yes gene_type:complete
MGANAYSITPKVLRGIRLLLDQPEIAIAIKAFKRTRDRKALKGIQQQDINAVLSVAAWREKWINSVNKEGNET